jgi:hypothetical protein
VVRKAAKDALLGAATGALIGALKGGTEQLENAAGMSREPGGNDDTSSNGREGG